MTPQILLDALRNAFLSLEMFCLLIFDESHRATGNHPYTKIMKVVAKRLPLLILFYSNNVNTLK